MDMKHTHGARGRLTIRLAGLFAALALVACSGMLSDTPPLTVPLAASMPGEAPEPVPLSRFFANRESTWGYKVSPDGQRLGWIASHARRATIFFRPVGDGQVSIIDTHSPRSVFGFEWAADSRRIFYLQDSDGDERYHVYLASIDAPWERPIDLTPWDGATSWVHRVPRTDTGHAVIMSNRRDRTVFDLWRVILDERVRAPVAAFATPHYPAAHFLDPQLAAALATLPRPPHSGLRLHSLDDGGERVTVEVFTERGVEYFLVERGRDPVLLARSASMMFADALGTTEPIVFDARDGVRLHGYLTRPPGFRAPGPMVLHVHGGHWARDYWGYDRV